MTFSFNPYAVFICNGFSIALLDQGDCFYLFDSLARDSDGMPNVNSKSILLKKTNIAGISLHLRRLFSFDNSITSTAVSQFDLHSLCISHVCRETIKRYQRAGVQICDITTYHPLQECISFELCPSQLDASSLLADSLNEHGSALLDSPLLCEELQTSLNKKRRLNDTSKDGLSSKKFKNKESSLVTQFHRLVSCGPKYICTSCCQTFFRYSVVKFDIQGLKPEMKRLCTSGHKSVEDKEWICQQCANSLKKNNLNKYLNFCQFRLRWARHSHHSCIWVCVHPYLSVLARNFAYSVVWNFSKTWPWDQICQGHALTSRI